MTILLGLIGFSIVVVVHELGHYIAARLSGIEVEAFSVGWGPTLFSAKRGSTEWRVSALPIGGYCKMKGEDSFRKALEEKSQHLEKIPGSFHSASPIRRIAVLASGPLANLILAVVLFSIVSLFGITLYTAPNKIILASEFDRSGGATVSLNPADEAGLSTGDIIESIGGKTIRDYADLQEAIALNPGKSLKVRLLRNGSIMETYVVPRLDKSSGQGLIGVYAWIDPIVETVEPGGSADIAGFRPGDLIVGIRDTSIENTIELSKALEDKPQAATFSILRDQKTLILNVVMSYNTDGRTDLGIVFKTEKRIDKSQGLLNAFKSGVEETGKSISLTLKGIALLFSGVDLLKALSGPARITYLVGATATESIKASGASGIPTILNFLAFLSVGLFFMNLLPIPALDGGQVLLAVIEWIKGAPFKVLTLYRYQFVGTALLLVLLVIATVGDMLYFAAR